MRLQATSQPRRRRSILLLPALALALLTACGAEQGGPKLALDDAIPAKAPAKTVLRVGDPTTEVALKLSGLDQDLPFDIEWANVTGGPKTLQAFRAKAIDVGSVADIPPLFAKWTGTDVRIIAARTTKDPLKFPAYQLGTAPGEDITSLADLRGKRIAYSPGQAQGALVLRALDKAGLTQKDVKLVEMTSVDDSFVNALGSKQVDVAPLQAILYKTYIAKYGAKGAGAIPSGVRDDAWTLYTPTTVLEDADKAAALKQYAVLWGKATKWINEHPTEFAKGYYVEHEGLSPADADWSVKRQGTYEVPATWSQVIADHQATADLLSKEQGHPKLDLAELYDKRFEKAGGEGFAGGGA